jgi:ubiquinone/menaquinone biosynthesis C-methylase UbiE
MLSELKSKPNDSIDLVICRQTFEHLSNGYIIDVLNEIKRVGKYLIINSNNTISENVEFTADGLNSRNINMDLEPFEPILGLPEFYFYDSIGQKTEGNLAYFYRLGNEI